MRSDEVDAAVYAAKQAAPEGPFDCLAGHPELEQLDGGDHPVLAAREPANRLVHGENLNLAPSSATSVRFSAL
jgi:hypothetical protein